MKSVTVRDLCRRWPETERALEAEGELVVTRYNKPVAMLVRYVASAKPRRRFDPVAQAKWQRKVNGGQVTRWVEEGLLAERDERSPSITNDTEQAAAARAIGYDVTVPT